MNWDWVVRRDIQKILQNLIVSTNKMLMKQILVLYGIFVVTIERQRIFTTRVTTDGDHGWLEIYDAGGNNLGAARTICNKIAWRSLDWIRENFPAFPPEIDWKLRKRNQ